MEVGAPGCLFSQPVPAGRRRWGWGARLPQDAGVNSWSQPGGGPVAAVRESPVHFIRATFNPRIIPETIPASACVLDTGKTRGSAGESWQHYFFFYYCYSCFSFTEEPCRTENLSFLQHRAFLSPSYLYFLLLLYLLWHVVTLTRMAFLFYVFFKKKKKDSKKREKNITAPPPLLGSDARRHHTSAYSISI